MPNEPIPISMPGVADAYLRAVRDKYNAIEIWPESDRWLAHVKGWIAGTIAEWQPRLGLTPSSRILNAGSGDKSYSIAPGMVINSDIADRKLVGMPCGVAGDLARLPLATGSVDVCVCVGSVVNYVPEHPRAIDEIGRVVKPGGSLILEFENSASLEYIGTPHFGRDVSLVSTFFINENENIWVYNERHMRRLLREAGFEVEAVSRAHFVAPLVHGYAQNIHYAARFLWLDRFIKYIPFLNRHSANVIYLCRRR